VPRPASNRTGRSRGAGTPGPGSGGARLTFRSAWVAAASATCVVAAAIGPAAAVGPVPPATATRPGTESVRPATPDPAPTPSSGGSTEVPPTTPAPTLPAHPSIPPPDLRWPPAAYVVADAGSGAVLAARHEHRALLPASTQKLMTALVALQLLDERETLTVGPRAAAQPAMRIGMKTGEVWTVADAVRSLLIVSANDAAYALAERASGRVEAFADAMNAAARRLGMHDSTFRDPAGLDGPEGVGGGSAVSAFDLAVLARNVLAVPALAGTARTREYHFTGPDGVGHVLSNHLRRFLDGYPGAFGLKPGYTSRALSTVVAAARRDGRTLVVTILGAGDSVAWAAALLDLGFSTPAGSEGTGAVLPPVRVDSHGRFLEATTDTRAGTGAAGRRRRDATGMPVPGVLVAPAAERGPTGAADANDAQDPPGRRGSWAAVAAATGGLALAAGGASVGAAKLSRRRRRRSRRPPS